jgi:uncharacterized protein YqeY
MSNSTLKPRLEAAMKAALRAGEKPRLSAVRLVLAALKQREIDERIEMDDAQVLSVLDKLVKQRRESIAQFEAAGRQDLVDKETFELRVIQEFLPEPLSQAELDDLVEAAIQATAAGSIKDMGKVMAWLKPRAQGRVDMAAAGAAVKKRLG